MRACWSKQRQGRDRTHSSRAAIPSVLAVALSTRASAIPTSRCSRCWYAVDRRGRRRSSSPSSSWSRGSCFASVGVPIGRLVFGGSRCVGFGLCWLRPLFLSLVHVAVRGGSWSLSLSLASISPGLRILAVFAAFSVLWVSARRRDSRCVVLGICREQFSPGGHSQSFYCLSQLQAAKVRGFLRLRGAVEPRDPRKGRWK